MWIICEADDSHERSRLIFCEKKKKKKKKKRKKENVICCSLRIKMSSSMKNLWKLRNKLFGFDELENVFFFGVCDVITT